MGRVGWAASLCLLASQGLPGQMRSARRQLAAWAGEASAWAAEVLASTGRPGSPVLLAGPGGLGVEPRVPPGSRGGDGASVSGPFPRHFLLQLLAASPRLPASLLPSGRRGWGFGLAWVHTHTYSHTQPHRHTQPHTGSHGHTPAHSHITVPPIHSHALAATHTPQKSPADICCPSQARALESPLGVHPPVPSRPTDSSGPTNARGRSHFPATPQTGPLSQVFSLPCPTDTCVPSPSRPLCPLPPPTDAGSFSTAPHIPSELEAQRGGEVVGRRGSASEQG